MRVFISICVCMYVFINYISIDIYLFIMFSVFKHVQTHFAANSSAMFGHQIFLSVKREHFPVLAPHTVEKNLNN